MMNTKTNSTDALNMLFGINYEVLKKNLDGVTHEESLIQPERGGNCLNWVLGHIVATRDYAIQLLNQAPIWDQEISSVYQRGSDPLRDGANAQLFAKIIADLDRSQERLVAGLSTVSEPELSAPAPDKSAAETVGETLFVLQFHEAYHAGQTGLLRRLAGHEGAIK
jgi:uncharacterized damage-inducible protein DinB